MKKVCLICKNEFEPNRMTPITQKYCSKKCQNKNTYINNKLDFNQKMKVHYIKTKEAYLERAKRYAKNNRDKIIQYRKDYRQKNKDKLREVDRTYRIKNKAILKIKKRNYANKRLKIDTKFAIRKRLRGRINLAIKKYKIEMKIMKCKHEFINYEKIIEHLKPFPEDISKYHLDHIRPLVSFDLTNDEEVRKAFAPENHQWLTIEQNLKKGGKYNEI